MTIVDIFQHIFAIELIERTQYVENVMLVKWDVTLTKQEHVVTVYHRSIFATKKILIIQFVENVGKEIQDVTLINIKHVIPVLRLPNINVTNQILCNLFVENVTMVNKVVIQTITKLVKIAFLRNSTNVIELMFKCQFVKSAEQEKKDVMLIRKKFVTLVLHQKNLNVTSQIPSILNA